MVPPAQPESSCSSGLPHPPPPPSLPPTPAQVTAAMDLASPQASPTVSVRLDAIHGSRSTCPPANQDTCVSGPVVSVIQAWGDSRQDPHSQVRRSSQGEGAQRGDDGERRRHHHSHHSGARNMGANIALPLPHNRTPHKQEQRTRASNHSGECGPWCGRRRMRGHPPTMMQ